MKKQILKITVSDNGQGFDPAKTRQGIGIENMMSRIQGINGQLCLTSAPGSGSMLEFSIPLKMQEGTGQMEAKKSSGQ